MRNILIFFYRDTTLRVRADLRITGGGGAVESGGLHFGDFFFAASCLVERCRFDGDLSMELPAVETAALARFLDATVGCTTVVDFTR